MRLLLVLLFPAALHADDQSAKLAEYAKGVYAEQTGDIKAARSHFEATLRADPDAFSVAHKTATTQLADQDLTAASGTLRAYANSHPEHLPSQLYYADFLEDYASHNDAALQTATEMLEKANTRHPHTADVFTRLINLYENREDRESSLALFEAQFEAPEAGPFHWMSLAPIARTLLPSDSEELAAHLETIALHTAETGLTIPRAVQTVSDYYRSTARLDEAILILQKHIEAVPDSLDLRTRLGLLLLYADRNEEAEQSLLETLTIDSDQVLAHKALSKYYNDSNNIEKTLHHRAEVLKIAGGDPGEFLDLANQYLDHGQAHPARLLLEKARFDHPEEAGIAARLAIATLRDGDTRTAARLFRQAESLAMDSDDPEVQKFLGADFQLEFAGSLREAGDLPAAEARLREAVRSTPPEQPLQAARALRELARLWLDQNKNQGPATSLLKRADTLDPGNVQTTELLKRARNNQ